MKRYRIEGEGEVDSINLANVLVLLSRGSVAAVGEADHGLAQHQPERVFECKTCNRRFPSFQALGGHRASHKKTRLAGDQPPAAARRKVHECSICGVEFAIGQALGGHMRLHRATAAGALRHALTKNRADAIVRGGGGGGRGEALCLDLDLNLSPPENDVELPALSLGLGLPMVDCLH